MSTNDENDQYLDQLASESAIVFNTVHELLELKNHEHLSTAESLTICTQYRCVIRGVSKKLNVRLDIKNHLQGLDGLFWLAQIMYLENPEYLGPSLVEWSRANFYDFTSNQESLEADVEAGLVSHVYKHANFWKLVYLHALSGNLTFVVRLLRIVDEPDHNECLKIAINLLNESQPLEDFKQSDGVIWNEWLSDIQSATQAGYFEKFHELNILFYIISGNIDVLQQLAKMNILRCWESALAPLILYTKVHNHPTTNSLSVIIQDAQNLVDKKSPNDIDLVFKQLMMDDLLSAFHELKEQRFLGSYWVLAHLADLLYHSGKTPILNSVQNGPNMHRVFLELYIDHLAESGLIHRALPYYANNNFCSPKNLKQLYMKYRLKDVANLPTKEILTLVDEVKYLDLNVRDCIPLNQFTDRLKALVVAVHLQNPEAIYGSVWRCIADCPLNVIQNLPEFNKIECTRASMALSVIGIFKYVAQAYIIMDYETTLRYLSDMFTTPKIKVHHMAVLRLCNITKKAAEYLLEAERPINETTRSRCALLIPYFQEYLFEIKCNGNATSFSTNFDAYLIEKKIRDTISLLVKLAAFA